MQRLTIALLAACLLGSGFGPATAQEQSPPPWYGGRVEMPQHGFAVAVPEGWVAFDLGDDIELQAQEFSMTIGALAGPASETTRLLISSRDQGMRFYAVEPESGAQCHAGMAPAPAGGIPEAAAFVHDRMQLEYAMTDVEEPRPVALAHLGGFAVAGRVPNDDSSMGVPITYYLLAPDGISASGALLLVTCTGVERPEDDWMSIVETFELVGASN